MLFAKFHTYEIKLTVIKIALQKITLRISKPSPSEPSVDICFIHFCEAMFGRTTQSTQEYPSVPTLLDAMSVILSQKIPLPVKFVINLIALHNSTLSQPKEVGHSVPSSVLMLIAMSPISEVFLKLASCCS